MKNRLLLIAFVFSGAVLFAQNPKIARTNAFNALQDYQSDKKSNFKMLEEAKAQIDISSASAETNIEPKTWLYRGQIYLELINNPLYATKFPNLAEEAANSFLKVVELDPKKKSKTEVHSGLLFCILGLFNDGSGAYNNKQYETSFKMFEKAIACYNGIVSYLDGKYTPADFRGELQGAAGINDLYYQTGIAAFNAGKMTDSEKYLRMVLDAKEDKPNDERIAMVYGILFDIYKSSNMDKAMSMLTEGRSKFPDNQTLLIKSIQVAIEAGRVGDLEKDLQKAISNDQSNASLHFALGTVYDERLKAAIVVVKDTKDEAAKGPLRAEVQSLFDKTKASYESATKIDPKFLDAFYNLGVMHFNQAVELNNEVVAIEDMKLYKQKLAELKPTIDNYYNQAVPYFAKVDELGRAAGTPEMKKTAAAACANIRDIYTRLENEEKMMEWSKKYKELTSGQ